MATVTTETTTSTPPDTEAKLLQQVTVIPTRTLDKSDERKTQALFFLAGGGMVMTLYAAAVLYIVQLNPRFAYYLGLCAMVNIFAIFTGICGMLVKRTLNISKGGLIVEDHNASKDQSS